MNDRLFTLGLGPGPGPPGYGAGLPFDKAYDAKPAFDGMQEALTP